MTPTNKSVNYIPHAPFCATHSLYTIKIPTVTLSSIALGTYLSHCWVLYIMKYKLHTDESSPGGGFNDGSNETKLQSK